MSALSTVLLLVHLLIALALVGVVLLQRSEGGALGIGGGGGGGGFLTGRGSANLLTRVTASLALCFFITSLLLTIFGQRPASGPSVLDRPAASGTATPGTPSPAEPAAPASGGILDKLK